MARLGWAGSGKAGNGQTRPDKEFFVSTCIFPMRQETETLTKKLLTISIGQVITYDELGSLIGGDVRPSGKLRHLLSTARRRVFKQRICFVAVPNIGLQRIDDVGKVTESSKQIVKSRRAGGRAIMLAVSVDDYNLMPPAVQTEHNRNITIAGVLRHFTSQPGLRKIENFVANTKEVLPVVRAIEAFNGS